jgi:hypothetical protein
MPLEIDNQLQFLELSVAEFSKFLGEGRESRSSELVAARANLSKEPKQGNLYAGWTKTLKSGMSLPSVIVLPSRSKSDFFAWSLSFISQIAPLTSLIRVLEWSEWISLRERMQQSAPLNVNILAALIFGEVASETPDSNSLGRIPLTAFDSSCSATLAQAFILNCRISTILEAAERWSEIRSLVGMTQRSVPISDIIKIWFLVSHSFGRVKDLELSEDETLISDTFDFVTEKEAFPVSLVRRLVGTRFDELGFVPEAQGNLEERIVKVDRFARFLSSSKIDPFVGGFLLGCSASLIAPGRTTHLDYVRRWRDSFPSVVMWYVLASSVHPRSVIHSERGYLCTRIAGRIAEFRSLSSRPDCDVALDEFRVMRRNEGAQFSIRLSSSGSMRVEILPMIVAAVRPVASEDRQLDLFSAKDSIRSEDSQKSDEQKEILRVFNDLRYELDHLRKLVIKDDRNRGRR